MTSFLDGPLVIMLSCGFFLLSLLFFTFNIFPTSSADKDGNVSLTHKTSSMLDEIFILEACTYDFFILEGLETLRGATGVGRDGITAEVAVGGGGETTTFKGRKIEGKEEEDFFATFSFNNLSLRYPGKIFSPTSLQIPLSLIGRRSYFMEYTDVIRPQKALTTATNSPASAFLSAGLCLR